MKIFQTNEIQTDLENHVDVNDTDVINTPKSKAVQSQLKKRIHRLLKKEENKFCMDCSKPNPRWISMLSVPPPYATEGKRHDVFQIGGFCCLECSGAHRRLGTHISFVRSIDLDSLQENYVAALENGGNETVNKIYEGKLFDTSLGESCVSVAFSNTIKPDASSSQKSRELFIRSKYEKKLYTDIKELSHFRQSMLTKMRNGFSLGDAVSPRAPQLDSPASFTSSADASSPVQLQVFTSSPRTLAMIEKYMKPKSKRKNIGHMIRNSLRGRGPRSAKKRYLQKSLRGLRGIVNVNPNLNIVETRSADFQDQDSDCGDYDIQSVTSTRSSISAFLRRGPMTDHKKIRSYHHISDKSRIAHTPTKVAEKKKRRFGRKRKQKKGNPTEEEMEVFRLKDQNIPSTPQSSTKAQRFRLTPYLMTPRRKNANIEDKETDNNENISNSSQLAARDCTDDVENDDCQLLHCDNNDRIPPEEVLVEDEEFIGKENIKAMKAWSAGLEGILIRMKKKYHGLMNDEPDDDEQKNFIEFVEEDESFLKANSM